MTSPPEASKKPVKRRFRISVRGLMVLVLVMGGGLGWFEHRARIQRDAVAVIKRSRGQVWYDLDSIENSTLKPWIGRLVNAIGIDRVGRVVGVRGSDPGFGDAEMKAVDRLADLEELDLWSSNVTDLGLANLGQFSRLKDLRVDGSKVTRAIFPRLAGLDRLEDVDFGTLDVADADLAHLSGLTRLQQVLCTGRRITDVGLSYLGASVGLERLGMHQTSITSAGLVHLASMRGLTYLNLNGSRVTTLAPIRSLTALDVIVVRESPLTDAGLEGVRGLVNLERLDLGGCGSITDAGLVHLRGLVKLEKLELDGTKVVGPGLADLAAIKAIRLLDLSQTSVTDASLVHLAGLTNLNRVILEDTAIGDAAVSHLIGPKGPKSLDLEGTRLTDAGLLKLANGKTVSDLLVRRTAVTDKGLQAAKLANPGTMIIAEPYLTGASK